MKKPQTKYKNRRLPGRKKYSCLHSTFDVLDETLIKEFSGPSGYRNYCKCKQCGNEFTIDHWETRSIKKSRWQRD